jgi:hypothetical protein
MLWYHDFDSLRFIAHFETTLLNSRRHVMLLRFTTSLLALTILAAPAASEVIFDVDFDAMTVGLPPSTGGPPDEPSSLHVGPNTSCTVMADFAGLAQKPVVLVEGTSQAHS